MLQEMPENVRRPLVFGLTSLAFVALLSLMWSMRRQGLFRLVPLALIMAGALGNLQDRFSRGYVIDFVRVHWRDEWSFAVFNLADSLITVGTVLLISEFVFRPAPKHR
jgi:signal peptidase II